MEKKQTNHRSQVTKTSWFERWFLNNKIVTTLLIVLLILLIILIFSKISHLFQPVASFFSVIGFPLILSGILYYLMNPLVNWLEKKKINRTAAIWMAFLVLILLIIWGVAILIPVIREQTIGIIDDIPEFWVKINELFNNLFTYDWFRSFQEQFKEINTSIFDALSSWANNFLSNTFSGISSVLGVVTNVFVGLITMPIILYYLLKEGDKFPNQILAFLPTRHRSTIKDLLTKINLQISQYVRGQITVAFFVGLMFVIGYSIIGLNYGIVLGVLAGFLNVIPYLGSFLAMVPAIIVGLVDSPIMLIQVLIVFSIEQFIEGRVISPQILGSNLSVHPVTIMIVLLTAGKVFGLVGFVLGIPGYAVLKVVFLHVFEWYKGYSGLYHEQSQSPPASNLIEEE
ncbi:AI-2E family transporter [Jeotgalibaca arthritidis]|uniref:AI-2E family transporter n=1 Tax=Jeotgalibaca arthritidis TaxID=1868794 RepID=A0A6G7K794_9LACT|nr:AI-2E family transporter [Jeotgalibaca arthritidis]QII81118.1 AI-2E family transporter [Jeotgalibaca arthritidis]